MSSVALPRALSLAFTRNIPVRAIPTLPAGRQTASALRPSAGSAAGRLHYGVVDYETLVDSPVFAGKYFRADDLGQGVTVNTVNGRACSDELLSC